VIAVDTNILIYAHRRDSPFYNAASKCLVELAEGNASWALPWPCVYEFIVIVTHPRIYVPATPLDGALSQVEAWLQSPSVSLLAESDVHWPALRKLLAASRIAGPQVHDAKIVAICMQHGVSELWSADRDFSRFAGLRVSNPMAR
jgi:toxin-antitoxin system PIN domain toxin